MMSLEGLKAYVTTEAGRRVWEDMVGSGLEAGPGVKWDGTVVVCDEGMEEDEMEGRSVPTLPPSCVRSIAASAPEAGCA